MPPPGVNGGSSLPMVPDRRNVFRESWLGPACCGSGCENQPDASGPGVGGAAPTWGGSMAGNVAGRVSSASTHMAGSSYVFPSPGATWLSWPSQGAGQGGCEPAR